MRSEKEIPRIPADILYGTVAPGKGIASGKNIDRETGLTNTIALQKPYFYDAGIPGAENMYEGTLNIHLPYEFAIIKPDYVVTCEWTPGVTETFWLIAAVVSHKEHEYAGYIYYPCPSSIKSHQDYIVEVLTEEIPDLSYYDSVVVSVGEGKITTSSVRSFPPALQERR